MILECLTIFRHGHQSYFKDLNHYQVQRALTQEKSSKFYSCESALNSSHNSYPSAISMIWSLWEPARMAKSQIVVRGNWRKFNSQFPFILNWKESSQSLVRGSRICSCCFAWECLSPSVLKGLVAKKATSSYSDYLTQNRKFTVKTLYAPS